MTDWKQAETFMAAVSRAVINPLSGLFIETTGEREFLICVKIVPSDRVWGVVVYDCPTPIFILLIRAIVMKESQLNRSSVDKDTLYALSTMNRIIIVERSMDWCR